MTLPYQRQRAYDQLYELAAALLKASLTPKVPRSIRCRAYMALRHAVRPEDFHKHYKAVD